MELEQQLLFCELLVRFYLVPILGVQPSIAIIIHHHICCLFIHICQLGWAQVQHVGVFLIVALDKAAGSFSLHRLIDVAVPLAAPDFYPNELIRVNHREWLLKFRPMRDLNLITGLKLVLNVIEPRRKFFVIRCQ